MSLWYKSWHSFVLTKLSKKEGDVLHCTSTAEITPSDWCLCEIWLHIIERHRASLPSLQMLFFFLFSYLMVSREAWFTHKLRRKCFSVWTVFVEKLKIPLQLCCVTLQEQKYCLPPARDGAFAASWLCRVSCSDRCKRDVKRKVGVGFSSGRPAPAEAGARLSLCSEYSSQHPKLLQKLVFDAQVGRRTSWGLQTLREPIVWMTKSVKSPVPWGGARGSNLTHTQKKTLNLAGEISCN